MLPYIDIFGREIPMYSVMVVIGVLFALLYLKFNVKRWKGNSADIELSCVYGVIGVFVGAKLLSLLINIPELISEIEYLFTATRLFFMKYMYSGFVFYGGLYGFLLAVWIYCRACRVNFYRMACIVVPIIPLIHAFGRIGCFCMGCCYGMEMDGGVIYRVSDIAPNGVPLMPVQLIESAAEFLIFACLAVMSRRGVKGRVILGAYLFVYGIVRFILEFFRGDDYRGFIAGMSVSQLISIITILAGFVLIIKKIRNKV